MPAHSSSAVALWVTLRARLGLPHLFYPAQTASHHGDSSGDKAVEKQAEIAHSVGGLWAAVKTADIAAVKRLAQEDASVLLSRGAVGETPLHLCFLYNTAAHKALARTLLELAPALIDTVYEEPMYHGENVLHMAIANNDEESARFLHGLCPRLVHGRADGSFFARGSTTYYGELPLSFAAVTNQANLVLFLVQECGASIADTDAHGNTAAHLCVIHRRLDMYSLLEQLWEKGYGRPAHLADAPLSSLTNADGYAPLVLAASLNMSDVVQELWTRQRRVEWCWGAVTAYLYPLKGVDDISDLLHGEEQQHSPVTVLETAVAHGWSDVLTTDLMARLLDLKWQRFVERHFMRRLARTLLFLCVLAATLVVRSHATERAALDVPTSWQSLPACLFALEASVCIVCLHALWTGLHAVSLSTRIVAARGASTLEHAVPFVASALILAAGALERVYGGAQSPDAFAPILLSAGAFLWWMHLLWYLLGFRLTGPFVIMLFNMLTGDVLRFFVLNAIFIAAFAQGMYVLGRYVGLHQLMLRVGESAAISLSPDLPSSVDGLQGWLQAVYVVFSALVSLNVLVAMFGDTYSRVTENADKDWRLERARITLSVERAMSRAARVSESCKYWTVMGQRAYLLVDEKNDAVFANEARVAQVQAAVAAVAAWAPRTPPSALIAAVDALTAAVGRRRRQSAGTGTVTASAAEGVATAAPPARAARVVRRRRASGTAS